MENPQAAAMQANGQLKSGPRFGTCWCFKRRSSHPGTFPKRHQLQVAVHPTPAAEERTKRRAIAPTPFLMTSCNISRFDRFGDELHSRAGSPNVFPLPAGLHAAGERDFTGWLKLIPKIHHAEHKQEVDATAASHWKHASSGNSVNIRKVLCN